jgi:hypothetical protein
MLYNINSKILTYYFMNMRWIVTHKQAYILKPYNLYKYIIIFIGYTSPK